MTKNDFAQYLAPITSPVHTLLSLVPWDKLEWNSSTGKFMLLGALIRYLIGMPSDNLGYCLGILKMGRMLLAASEHLLHHKMQLYVS